MTPFDRANADLTDPTPRAWLVFVVSSSLARRGKHAPGTVVEIVEYESAKGYAPSADMAREYIAERRTLTNAECAALLADKDQKAAALDVTNNAAADRRDPNRIAKRNAIYAAERLAQQAKLDAARAAEASRIAAMDASREGA